MSAPAAARAAAREAARTAAAERLRITYPEALPVSARREDLLAALRDHQVVVVAGETGSGKTTQLPKVLLELGCGRAGQIAHTQPRRIAARAVAQRLAEELQVPLGDAVGFSVRFGDRSSDDTLVRLMTDGLLLAETRRDRLLRRYDAIIVDEAHERSLNIDFLLGYLASILPQRPDLKVVITSATIDVERMARHFGDAPVVEVSGRTFPVEVRYRPPEEDDGADEPELVADACEELLDELGGDVLVFLSGEREIRDCEDVLRGRLGPDVEVLPLYARLSAAEQQRVFKPARGRRVVLSTNVAETSLTVPGIRAVVDTGVARVSRYSARLKVQRLPVEPVSQASAKQRAGRCGRLGPGVCVRLYDEEDHDARPAFTDPEVLRTNLASVLLQMASLDLGDVEDFPFLDPPDRRQVRDGLALLSELGALDDRGRLTTIGRRLARLPVDPRLGRMVLEADRLRCATEVAVIVAALSIQDVRERPAEHRAQADQLHARFKADGSDFLTLLNLWNHLRARSRELGSNAFRREVRKEHLHFLRVREWQDLVSQVRTAAREAGVRFNDEPAEPDAVHRALLAGLLSQLGVRDAKGREFTGARGARFAVHPGSVLSRKPPAWVMCAELVETSRLFGRTAARIDPRWVEPLARHLVRRSYGEPRWDRRRASVVTTERVTLYGLPVVTGRAVPYARMDPDGARRTFLQKALVERDWDAHHAFFTANGKLLEELEGMEARLRRRDVVVSDTVLLGFFDERVPDHVVSGTSFDRWWREQRKATPDLLTYTHELLLSPEARAADRGRPPAWRQGDLELRLSYAFDPGSEADGVTVHVPLDVLGEVSPAGFDWLVPALREELVTALLRGLPKGWRTRLVPIPDTARAVVERLAPRRGTVAEAVAAQVEALRGVRIPVAEFRPEALPPHLRMRFSIEGPDGEVLAAGADLEALRRELAPKLRERLADTAPELVRSGLTRWTVGTLPREVVAPGTGGVARGFPALVDEGASVGVRLLDDEDAQRAAMRDGTRRLLLLTTRSPARGIADRLDLRAQVQLAGAPHGSLAAVVRDCLEAAVDQVVADAGGVAWDEAGFSALQGAVRTRAPELTAAALDAVLAALGAADALRERLAAVGRALPPEVRADVEHQLARLVGPHMAVEVGARHLPDVERWLRAAAHRLARLAANPAADREKMAQVHELEAAFAAAAAGRPPAALPPHLAEVPWLLEELRVQLFAQGLGTRVTVSPKRIRQALSRSA